MSETDTVEIHLYGCDVLDQRADPFDFDRPYDPVGLARRLEDGMIAADGVGLAAPQIGLSVQVFAYDVPDSDHQGVLFNPDIVEAEGEIRCPEGCLSIPHYNAVVTRSQRVVVEALNEHREEVTVEAEDLAAVVLQHEIDHLRGHTFVHRLSPFKKSQFRKRWKKIRRLAREDPHGNTVELERP